MEGHNVRARQVVEKMNKTMDTMNNGDNDRKINNGELCRKRQLYRQKR